MAYVLREVGRAMRRELGVPDPEPNLSGESQSIVRGLCVNERTEREVS